jgi:hypothetical protein
MVAPTLSLVPDPRTDRLAVRPANRSSDMDSRRTTDNLFDSMRKRDPSIATLPSAVLSPYPCRPRGRTHPEMAFHRPWWQTKDALPPNRSFGDCGSS